MDKKTVRPEFVLTHRTDLKERVVPRALTGDYNTNSGQTVVTPIQSIKGKLIAVKEGGGLLIDHPKHGEVLVHTNRPALGKKDGPIAQLQVEGKDIALTMDGTGKGLAIKTDRGGFKLIFESPAAPKYLVPESTQSTARGSLKEFYDRCRCVEVVENGQNVLLRGDMAGASETTLRKMLGKDVEATVGKDGKLKVKSQEIEKSLSR